MILKDLTSILSVRYCLGCGKMLLEEEEVLCVGCRELLCETGFERIANNSLEQALSHRCRTEAATSLFFFEKDKLAQLLIHKLKYEGWEQIGEWLGLWIGKRLVESARFAEVDVVIPVPLHPDKLRKRGYNQVTLLGKSIAYSMGVAFDDSSFIKTTANSTQTRKFMWKRYNEATHIFTVANPKALVGKHVLLVDGVITTGSTIERCYQELTSVEGVKVSVASIACAIVK